VTGLETATLGQNIFAGMLNEVNFMEVVERSTKSPDGEYDQANALYNSIARRRKSRFLKQGRLPGIVCLVSSRRYPGQFTDQKEAEAARELSETGQTTIYVYDKRTWDIKPDAFCGETFEVFVGDATRKPRILQGEEFPPDQVIEVPIEYRREFEQDILKAMRDIAGVSTLAVHPFLMDSEKVSACFGQRESILSRTECDFQEIGLQVHPSRIEAPESPRFIHVDLALTQDSAGVAMGWVPGFTQVERGSDIEILPNINIDFSLEIMPPKGSEILIWKVRDLIYKLIDCGVNVKWVSFDGYQSADSIQVLRQKGLMTGKASMDRTTAPYELLKMALYDGRVNCPEHPKLLTELLSLELDVQRGKIDHPVRGSKDIADALAGVVYGLTMRREVWVKHGVPTTRIPKSLIEQIKKTGGMGDDEA
jgi:hypothetical protein